MYYFLGLVVAFIAGGLVMYFVLRNNPKLLNIEKLTKEQLEALQTNIKEKLGK